MEPTRANLPLVTVAGTPGQYEIFPFEGHEPRKSTMIELHIPGALNEIDLYFGDAPEIEFVSDSGTLLEMHLPLAMMEECLSVLNGCSTPIFSTSYDPITGKVHQFMLHSVKK